MTTEIEIQLACRLLFVDMEGLNDGRAVKTIVPQVNPRKMVGLAIKLHCVTPTCPPLDHRSRPAKCDGNADRELWQYSCDDQGYIRPNSRREHTNRAADQQLLYIYQR